MSLLLRLKSMGLLMLILLWSFSAGSQTSHQKPRPISGQAAKTTGHTAGKVGKSGASKKNRKTAAQVKAAPDLAMGVQELAIAERVHLGRLPCELGATIRLEADTLQPGYFHVQGQGFRYRMHPVATTTGAIRLEDKKAGTVWLQLANKSMLMDQKRGRRLANDCVHPEQMAFAEHMKSNPPPVLFDTQGMGRTND